MQSRLAKLILQTLAVPAILACSHSATDNLDGTTPYVIDYVYDFTGWDTSDPCAAGDDTCGAERATHLGAVHFSFSGSENPDTALQSVAPQVYRGLGIV